MAKDSMECHHGSKFSTNDDDNYDGASCASFYEGAWWYKGCMKCTMLNMAIFQRSTLEILE